MPDVWIVYGKIGRRWSDISSVSIFQRSTSSECIDEQPLRRFPHVPFDMWLDKRGGFAQDLSKQGVRRTAEAFAFGTSKAAMLEPGALC